MKSRYYLIALHVLAWLIFLSIPLLIFPIRNDLPTEDGNHFRLSPIFINSIFLVSLFYINYYLLIPKFYFTKKYLAYTVLCLGSLILIMSVPFLIFQLFNNGPPPVHFPPNPHIRSIIPMAVTNTLLMYIVAFFASIFLRVNDQLKKIEREKLATHLSYLKTQINPHFLFNTLNSIYSVTIGKVPQAAEMVDKLAEMMRYTLREAQDDSIPLDREINYIKNYIDLQKVRFDNSVNFQFSVHGDFSGKYIAPLLLIPFIENAFKHGVNSEQNSDIKIILSVAGDELHLKVINNKVQIEKIKDERDGIGIENTKHRLQLIYPSKHTLLISETEDYFSVSLHINLK